MSRPPAHLMGPPVASRSCQPSGTCNGSAVALQGLGKEAEVRPLARRCSPEGMQGDYLAALLPPDVPGPPLWDWIQGSE